MVGKGLFIVADGIDGCGKSSQALKLADWIFSNYKKIDTIVLTHEPTHSKFGLEIASRLSRSSKDESATSKERLLELFVLDREQHVNDIIAPALEKKCVVICERYKYSTIAYQSAQGVPIAHAIEENGGFPVPDIAFIFNASVENCVSRLEKSGKMLDKFEKSSFLEKVKEQYLKLPALLSKEKIQIINANKSIEMVHDDVIKAIRPLVEEMVK